MNARKLFNLMLIIVFVFSFFWMPAPVLAEETLPNPSLNLIEYPTILSGPAGGMTIGPDGSVWFAEWGSPMIGRITTDGMVTEYYNGCNSVDTILGPDGRIWFTGMLYGYPPGGYLGQVMSDGSITKYQIPTQYQFAPSHLTVGPDGNIWFTKGNGQIGKFSLDGTFTEFPAYVDTPSGITLGLDGNLWFAAYGSSKIGRITLDGEVSLYSVPTPSGPTPTGATNPTDIVTGPDGNMWFVEYWGPNVGRITPEGEITEYPLSSGYGTTAVTVGPDGNIWFAEPFNDKIGNITTSGIMTEYAMPAGSAPNQVAASPDGSIWISFSGSQKIARIILEQKPVVEAGMDQTVFAGQTISLSASASFDPGGSALTYAWDINQDGQYVDASGVAITTSINQPGTYVIGLRVANAGGLSDTDTLVVTVLAWRLNGFYQPVDMNGIVNIVKNGSTVPFKFEVFAGAPELTDIAYIKGFTYSQIICDTNAAVDEIETTATGGTSLRYDASAGQFVYNWKTPRSASNCYRVVMKTVDGSVLFAYFKLK
ncbi:MAG: PxKF domain-containing protein [Chloroflexota bacterium]